MDVRDKILAFLKIKGPSVASAVGKNIEKDSIFASAFLSELKEAGKLRLSYLKIGSSPLYYLPGQEDGLQNYSNYLHEKEKKVYDLLKEKKVLRDTELVPVFRAAIKELRDFAFPLNVTYNNQKEIFWKWYLLPDNEAEQILKHILKVKEEKVQEPKEEKEEPKEPEKKKEEPLEEKKKEEPKEEPQKKKIEGQELSREMPEVRLKRSQVQETQKKIGKEETDVKTEKQSKDNGEFYDDIRSFLEKNKIKIIEENLIKKKSEIDFIVDIPSSLGGLRYYVKAKNKKKVNEGDISSAFVVSQSKRLPVLFLSPGDLMKNAKEMLDSEFKGMKYVKME